MHHISQLLTRNNGEPKTSPNVTYVKYYPSVAFCRALYLQPSISKFITHISQLQTRNYREPKPSPNGTYVKYYKYYPLSPFLPSVVLDILLIKNSVGRWVEY